jgi:hypothetical protein
MEYDFHPSPQFCWLVSWKLRAEREEGEEGEEGRGKKEIYTQQTK